MEYLCLACRAGLLPAASEYGCPQCGAVYPIHHGVPLLVRQVKVDVLPPRPDIDDEARAILRYFGLPESAELRATLARILGNHYEFPQSGYSAENNCVLTRLRAATRGAENGSPRDEDGGIHAEILLDYLPDRLEADLVSSHNVRLLNAGGWLTSTGDFPVHLSYHWYVADGHVVEWDGLRTRFPVDVAPGRAITLPMQLKTPAAAGVYTLHLDLVRESVAWGGLHPWSKTIGIGRSVPSPVPGSWMVTPSDKTYEQDHDAARELLGSWLSEIRRGQLNVLEVGGTSSPQTPVYGHPVWNVDIDVQSLQIGVVLYRHMPERKCTFVCADAGDLPFAPATFDCIALFSALHHFADPAATIRYLSGFLQPDGFLAILCEPSGHNVEDAQYLHELRSGINEQTFSLPEYELIFRRAGVTVMKLQVDGGSVKAQLSPQV